MRIIFLFFIISFRMAAQPGDSLLMAIKAMRNDTQKVNRLYSAGFSLRNSDPVLAMDYANFCEQTAKTVASPKHLAKSYNLKGILLYKKGQYAEAISYHTQALKIRNETHDKYGAGLSLVNLGNTYSSILNYSKAEDAYLKAMELFRELDLEKNVGDCLVNIGVLNQEQHRLKEAEENYKMALAIAEERNDYDLKSICLNNLAQVFYEQGIYERSIELNHDAIKLRTLMDNNVEIADSYLNLGASHLKLKEFETTKKCLDTAFYISSQFDYFEGLQSARQGYSDYYFQTKDFEKAYFWLHQYQQKKDSIASQIAEGQFAGGFVNQPGQPEAGTLNNLWLIILIFIFMIFVPLFLVQYKR